ncbi:hypothetical protein [Methylobacterium oryzae]|uniref:hypothetical protein n=1 Tax=Methylobacterium oryzae TaxID=334852 RepID=UPI001F1CB57F|nr:hypothetical protein [Methylobacterium oryzae]UIN36888.1 hypothetical protein LXM90_10490 [Methylobacterium oryzae]
MRVQARLHEVENQLDRFHALEFWDRVMQEIFKIIPAGGAMTPGEILTKLRPWTIRGAAFHKEPLKPVTVKEKMDVRVGFGRYFEAQPDGRYGRRRGLTPHGKPRGAADYGATFGGLTAAAQRARVWASHRSDAARAACASSRMGYTELALISQRT